MQETEKANEDYCRANEVAVIWQALDVSWTSLIEANCIYGSIPTLSYASLLLGLQC